MKMKDIRTMSAAELHSLLKKSQMELRQLKAKALAQDLKNVRAIRQWRRLIARLHTRLRELKDTANIK